VLSKKTMNKFLKEYDSYENTLLEQYKKSDFFTRVQDLSDREYTYYLLQLGHFSFEFINWIQTALFGLENEKIKEVARHILREEVPDNMPTHQEERLYDMEQIGVSKAEVVASKPNPETKTVIEKRLALIAFPQEHYDLKTLVTLRFDGEVLAGETFGQITKELKRRFNLVPEKSRYYSPHFIHDQKNAQVKYDDKYSHADAYYEALAVLIKEEKDLKTACESAKKAFDLRIYFHSQFLTSGGNSS